MWVAEYSTHTHTHTHTHTTHTHTPSQVVCLSDCRVLVSDPHWLGTHLTALLSRQHSVTGRFSLAQLTSLLPSAHPPSVASLCEHLRLCIAIEDREKFLFPCLIQMEPVYGVWERDPMLTRYAGVCVKCQSKGDMFSPGLFHRIQGRLGKMFSDNELSLWMGGAKLTRGNVEALLNVSEPNKAIQVLVRGALGTGGQCYTLLTQLYSLVIQTVHSVSPGTGYSSRILSALQLTEHCQNPASYSLLELYRARQAATPLPHPTIADCTETVSDLLYCGATNAESAVLLDLPGQTVCELSGLLDPPDRLGRDWGLLALQLELTDRAATIHLATSPTAKLLEVWSHVGSIEGLVDALECLGRVDAASLIISSTSPYSEYYKIAPTTSTSDC